MFCEKCGKQIPDGSAFCDGCGAKLTQEAAPVEAAAPVAAPAAPAAAAAPAAKPNFFAVLAAKAKAIHQKNKLIFPIAGAVLVVAIAVLVVLGILGRQVSMKDYMDVQAEGYDGYGYVTFDFGHTSFGMRAVGDKDVEGYDEDLEEDEDFRYMDKSDVDKEYRDNFKDAQKLVESIEFELTYPEDKSNGRLSNGDVIKVEIKCDEDRAEELGLTLQDLSFEYTVEGLKAVSEVDILSYFDLVGEGYDGYGRVQLKCNTTGTKQIGSLIFDMEKGQNYITYHYEDEEWTNSIYPYINDSYNKSNGDKVEAKVDYSEDYFLERGGVKLINLTKELTVSDLKESQEVDLLSYFDIKFVGMNGSGRGEVTPKQETATFGEYTVNLQTGEWTKGDEYVGYTYVYLESSYNLTNGDEVKAYVSYSEYTFGEAGVKFINAEQNVKVANLAEYVTDLDKVTDYSAISEKAQEDIIDYLTYSWSWAVHRDYRSYSNKTIDKDIKLYKAVLKVAADSANYYENQMYLVFAVKLNDNAIKTPTVYYIAVSVDNASVYGDGALNDYNVYLSNHAAYTSYSDLYTEVIDSDRYYSWTITETDKF